MGLIMDYLIALTNVIIHTVSQDTWGQSNELWLYFFLMM